LVEAERDLKLCRGSDVVGDSGRCESCAGELIDVVVERGGSLEVIAGDEEEVDDDLEGEGLSEATEVGREECEGDGGFLVISVLRGC